MCGWKPQIKERVRLASADTLDFELSRNNSTAVMENNVLTFTGEGLISVRPLSHEDAVLHVELDSGKFLKKKGVALGAVIWYP